LADSDIQVIPQNVCQTLGGYSLAYFEWKILLLQ
jgi:hypothetical protein